MNTGFPTLNPIFLVLDHTASLTAPSLLMMAMVLGVPTRERGVPSGFLISSHSPGIRELPARKLQVSRERGAVLVPG